jgi:hypothetical protein
MGHIGHDLRRCFDMHLNYLEHGAMLPGLGSDDLRADSVPRQSNGK